MQEEIERHYTQLAENYDATWGHRPDYLDWMEQRIQARLDLRPDRWIGDIGAGTGLFLRRLMQYASPERPVVCVDPSQAMLDRLPRDPRLRPVRATAEEVAAGRAPLPCDSFGSLVVKEAVHHFSELDRTLAGLAGRLAPGGRILIVTLPPKIGYPLFQAALDRFAAGQPEPETIAAALRAAGLTTSVEYDAYPVSIHRDLWVRLVRGRWMSVLSTFSDDELEQGVAEMVERHPDERLEFPDRFAFITGRRDDAPAGTRTFPSPPRRRERPSTAGAVEGLTARPLQCSEHRPGSGEAGGNPALTRNRVRSRPRRVPSFRGGGAPGRESEYR